MKVLRRNLSALALIAFAVSPTLAAENAVITTCELGRGYAYYPPGQLSPGTPSGWQEDGFSPGVGQVTLLRTGSDYELILKDVVNTFSVKEQGGTLTAMLGDAPNSIAVSVFYPQGPTLEAYLFLLDGSGQGLVMWTSARASVGLAGRKVGAYAGTCQK